MGRPEVEQFLSHRREHEMIPLDDQDLSMEMFLQRRDRRLANASEREAELRVILEKTQMSPFMIDHLIEESTLSSSTGYTNDRNLPAVDKRVYGINLEQDEYGVFEDDPEKALYAEVKYFTQAIPYLRWCEEIGNERKVSWREWGIYLDAKLDQYI